MHTTRGCIGSPPRAPREDLRAEKAPACRLGKLDGSLRKSVGPSTPHPRHSPALRWAVATRRSSVALGVMSLVAQPVHRDFGEQGIALVPEKSSLGPPRLIQHFLDFSGRKCHQCGGRVLSWGCICYSFCWGTLFSDITTFCPLPKDPLSGHWAPLTALHRTSALSHVPRNSPPHAPTL